MYKSYSYEKGLYMLTKDGSLWMDGATKSMIWFERFFRYDTVFPMKRGVFFIYALPAGLFIGLMPAVAVALLEPSAARQAGTLQTAAIVSVLANASIWVGITIRKIDKFPRWKVHYAAGDYPRIELLILAQNNTKQYRECLWKHRNLVSDLLEKSGNSDTSEFGLESAARRITELERRKFIKYTTTAILTTMGEDPVGAEAIVKSEFDKLDQLERDRLDKYELSCHQSIVNANQSILSNEQRLEELSILRIMMYR